MKFLGISIKRSQKRDGSGKYLDADGSNETKTVKRLAGIVGGINESLLQNVEFMTKMNKFMQTQSLSNMEMMQNIVPVGDSGSDDSWMGIIKEAIPIFTKMMQGNGQSPHSFGEAGVHPSPPSPLQTPSPPSTDTPEPGPKQPTLPEVLGIINKLPQSVITEKGIKQYLPKEIDVKDFKKAINKIHKGLE